MTRQYFDDGSWLEVTADGTSYAANTEGTVVSKVEADGDYFRSATYWTDAREDAKLNPYIAAPNGDTRPWWERAAEYGLTRAIDSHFGPPAVNKTAVPATFAGQNGLTYSQVGGQPQYGNGGSLLPLMIAAGIAFVALG